MPERTAGDPGMAKLRERLRPLVHRARTRGTAIDRLVTEVVDRQQARPRLVAMYEALRRAYAGGRVHSARIPTGDQVQLVLDEALRARIFAHFFHNLGTDGDFERAAVELTRGFLRRKEPSRARSIAQVFACNDQLRPIAEVCLGICAFSEPMPGTAWTLFSRNDLALVLRWAANEYFQLAFARDPAAAQAALERVLSGTVELRGGPDTWLHVAYHAFSADCFDSARQALGRADAALAGVTDATRARRLRARADALRDWLERAAAVPAAAPPVGEVPFALVGFQHPYRDAVSRDLDDPIETLTVLGQLLRFDGVRFTGEPALVAAAEQLRATVPANRMVEGGARPVRLYEVARDVSRHAAVPDGTWVVVSDWFTHPLGGPRYDMPLNPRLRPLFVSFHIEPPALAAPGVVDYLRRYGPIGCRDRDTVYLLLAAGVPAFFSGTLAMTVDAAVPPEQTGGTGHRAIFVDLPAHRTGKHASRLSDAVRERGLGANLTAAAAELREYRDSGARVVTSDVRFYLAARAVGCPAELRGADAGDARVVDYVGLSDAEFTAMQRDMTRRLGAVLDAILAGRPEDEVYDVWRTHCADDVARAEADLHSVSGDPALAFDLDEACRVIRTGALTVERSAPAPGDGTEVNVEFSVDKNYKHQLEIVLDSIVARTERPVRAFILCRGLTRAYLDRLTGLFPTVSFVWLPTDNVHYGHIPEKIRWATVVTMDRTMLPLILPEVDRIIHFDLDALCLADLGELFDVDLEGSAIAAVDAPQPVYLGGLDTFRRAARRMRRDGDFDLARELILRTHAQHPFDFEIFNAGIMVMDLAKMRVDDVCRRYMGYIQRFGLNGQVIMNLYVGRERKKLDADWNRLVRLEVAGPPKIAHWAGPYKPWKGHQYVSGRELWLEQEAHFAARTERRPAAAAPAR